jgi:hypothetical protein
MSRLETDVQRMLLRSVSAALMDNGLPIPPLHRLIVDYARFVGTLFVFG